MRIQESDLFGKLDAPTSFNQLLSMILEPPKPKGNNVWMWRGHASIDWRIDSSAYRRLKTKTAKPTDRDIEWYEKSLIKRAKHRGYNFFDGHDLSDFDVLARLQHHGAATRLLDATRSALVGLFFACSTEPQKTGILLGFHSFTLGGYEGEPKPESYDDVVQGLAKFSHAVTWQPPDVSPRIAAQHSQFLYSAVSDNAMGSLRFEKEREDFLAIPIFPSIKEKSLTILRESFDIRDLTLFPDLDGFARSNASDQHPYSYARW
ncbi:FRG domain-containing protein [Aurantiacibacter gangjinensis]|uniref:FRG domain-containing protein n=1 Tax=Aurantiacibacter gangjinensis TaxID=502682 RepID=A0A0G9ML00_9SPHN|nr:FRG domain-containing protein [Aurantiacibacter gangjinensis]KLE31362.1 hypothetical protein AAW01_07075 [Aurantiacibacter gangjinensis]